jgi:hypothetical protein
MGRGQRGRWTVLLALNSSLRAAFLYFGPSPVRTRREKKRPWSLPVRTCWSKIQGDLGVHVWKGRDKCWLALLGGLVLRRWRRQGRAVEEIAGYGVAAGACTLLHVPQGRPPGP